jgi:hypothetical protein
MRIGISEDTMQNRAQVFAEYLNHIKDYVQQQAVAGNKLQADIYKGTEECIKYMIDNNHYSKVGRVFNFYPLSYQVKLNNQDQQFAVLSPEEEKRINNLFMESLSMGSLSRKVDGQGVIADEKTQQAICEYIANMLDTACLQLLNDKGEVYPHIIEFLGLQELLADKQKNVDVQKVIYQIIISHVSQILHSNFMQDFVKSLALAENGLPDFDKIERQSMVNVFVEQYLASVKNVNNYIIKHMSKFSPLSEIFANYLKNMPIDDITLLVKQDMRKSYGDLDNLNGLLNILLEKRSQFWFDIMSELQNQNQFKILSAIYAGLPREIQDRWDKLPGSLPIPIQEELNTLPEFKHEIVSPSFYIASKTESAVSDEEETIDQAARVAAEADRVDDDRVIIFTQWLNQRDNNNTIDHIIQHLTWNEAEMSEKQEIVLQELRQAKNMHVAIHYPPAGFFQAILETSSHPLQMLNLLRKTVPQIAENLDIAFSDDLTNAIKLALSNKNWKEAVPLMLMLKDDTKLTKEDMIIFKNNKAAILAELKNYISTLDSKEEQLAILDNTINRVNVLGEKLALPTSKKMLIAGHKVKTLFHKNVNSEPTTNSILELQKLRDNIFEQVIIDQGTRRRSH